MGLVDASRADLGVSVVIPAYNAAAYLPHTLDSVFAQTWRNFEVVVVDDGSTDETPSLLLSYKEQHPDILTMVSQANSGQSAARNAGILASRQPYVALLDADDRWHPSKLERQLQAFTLDPELKFCSTGYTSREDGAEPRDAVIADWDDAPLKVLGRLLLSNCILTSSVMATRKLLLDVGLFDPTIRWGEEYDLWLRIGAAGYRMGYIQEALVRYDPGSAGISVTAYRKGADAYIPVMKKRFAQGDFPQPIQQKQRRYLAQRHLNNASGYLAAHQFERALRSLACAACQRPASVRPGWIAILARAAAGAVSWRMAGE